MKYYETLYEEYINSCELYNLHPELNNEIAKLPTNIATNKYNHPQKMTYLP